MSFRTWTERDDIEAKKMISGLPEHLYHYRSLKGQRKEWIKETIVDSKLYFSRPNQFNDPLDCKIPPTFNSSSFKINIFWRKYIQSKYPGEKIRNHKKAIQQMVKDSKTKEGQKKLSLNIFETLDNNGMLCLSKDPVSMLMWSYYANGHEGICCRFKMNPQYLISIAKIHYPIEVKYEVEFPEVNFYEANTFDLTRTILGTKAIDWKHEEEWRIIIPHTAGKLSFPPEMLDGIIFGMRTSKSDKEMIREWIGSRGIPIETFQVSNKPRSFELEINPE